MPTPRLDRLASVHVFHRLSRITNGPSARRIPILMYHSIQDTLSGGGPYYETTTSPAVFERHMRFLSDHGYSAITLQQAVTVLGQPGGVERPVAITFDDGCRSF